VVLKTYLTKTGQKFIKVMDNTCSIHLSKAVFVFEIGLEQDSHYTTTNASKDN
jgi:homoserine acetyltransferase